MIPTADQADIGLLLEGTYPYVAGGVSTWVHEILRGLPEFRFGLIFLGGSRDSYGEMKYTLPPNVVHLERHYLMDDEAVETRRGSRGNPSAFADSAALHDYFRDPRHTLSSGLLDRLVEGFGTHRGISRDAFLHSELAWDQIRQSYRSHCTDPSFLDYFWTVRTMHGPLFRLAQIARQAPRFRALHAISTGYAGFLGMLMQRLGQLPLVLTEHGIYTKERQIDLAHADWIRDLREVFGGSLDDDVSYVRRLWIRFFEGIGRLAYASADPIISLYEGNRQRQILDGAEAGRTRIIPNGIALNRFSPLRAQRPREIPKVLGLIGRIVPIKDIRTFIRAMRTVCNRLPDAEGWIIGGEEEAPEYATECQALVESLGLSGRVKFLGFQPPEEVLPKLGLLVLTSISEALPLVVLEAFASGLPVLVTDVGSCRELVEGRNPEDHAIGTAGSVVSIADPEATARAAVELLTQPARWQAAQASAIARVERYYTEAQMFDAYRAIYSSVLGM